jgi:hypothetical protein
MKLLDFEQEWKVIRTFLPAQLDESARNCGAMQRKRGGVQDGETLLRLILMHVGGGLSLEQTVIRAQEHGLATLSAVALFKRLRRCESWLQELTSELLCQMPARALSRLGAPYQVRVLDSTCVSEPGATGTSWRLHYSLKLPEMVCDFFEITDVHGGEFLQRLPVSRGDVVLADRGYCKKVGLAPLLETGADIVMRLLPSSFPLESRDGKALNLAERLSLTLLNEGDILEIPVQFEFDRRVYPLRLCTLRKSEAACALAQRKARSISKKRGVTIRQTTLEMAAYVCVITSLPSEIISTKEVLELYRCRWQIELAFKRLKSLLELGALPKKDPPSCRAWMQAKVLIALLTERLILESELFSPWGYRLR